MVRVRAPCCSKLGVKKGPWTEEEDARLIACIEMYGHSNWHALPKQAGLLRCGKSCRLRWMNYLRPGIKRGNYTEEEIETVIKLHNTLGNKWSRIASSLPGRTDNEIKNLWKKYFNKKEATKESHEAKNNPTETPKTSASGTANSFTDNQISKSDTDQYASRKYATAASSTEIHNNNPSELSSDLTSYLQTSVPTPPLMELNMEQSSIWEIDMDANIPMMESTCSSSSEMIQALEIPEFTLEQETWDILDQHVNNGGKSCNIDQIGLNPETEKESYEIGDWLVNLEQELGLWDTNIEEAHGNQMVHLLELESDPIVTYFQNLPTELFSSYECGFEV